MEVHRCQFVEYVPEAVHCMAFNDDASILAVSRANADIELWNVKNDWLLERIIPGGESQSVEALCWVGKRLFSAGLHGFITEWDLRTLQPKAIVDSYGGPVWCLAASTSGDQLAAGCEDGCVRLFDVTDGGLHYARAFEKQNARILSIAWHESDAVLVTGSADSKIHKWSVRSGRSTLRITVEDLHKESTLVWTVAVLSDMTILSGDSLGNTHVWDGTHGTLKQTLKLHDADVLALVVNRNEDTAYVSGIDHKVVQLRLVESGADGARKWVSTDKQRVHTHDVRALAISRAPGSDLLVSGGIDTQLIVYSADKFGGLGIRRIPPFPHRPFLHMAPEAHALLFQQARKLQVWRLGSAGFSEQMDGITRLADGTQLNVTDPPSLLVEIKPKGNHNVYTAAISRAASYMAFSDSTATKVFRLALADNRTRKCSVSKVRDFALASVFSHALAFTPDERLLVSAGSDSVLRLVDLESPEQIACEFSEHRATGPIIRLAVSADGRWLASGDVSNKIHVFDLKKKKLHCTLPVFDTQHCALAFHPKTAQLLVACVCNRVYAYDTHNMCLSDWSRANSTRFPHSFLKKKQKTIAMAFDPAVENSVLVYDHYMITRLDLDKTIEEGVHTHAFKRTFDMDRKQQHQQGKGTKKHKKGQTQSRSLSDPSQFMEVDGDVNSSAANLAVGRQLYTINRYQPVLLADFMGPRNMVVVERPWLSVMTQFPAPLQRRRYGT